MAREEIITKCKESLRIRISELETALEEKEKKLVDMTDKFMNDKNSRISAETSEQEVKTQLEEIQKTLESCQENNLELEAEVELYRKEDGRLKEAFHDCLSEEDTGGLVSKDLDETFEGSGRSHLKSFASLSEKFAKEQEKSFVLEDRVKELEQMVQDMNDNQTEFAKEAIKKEEWLSAMLEREREINEKLSNESDMNMAELQKRLSEMNEVNSVLSKSREDAFEQVNSHQEVMEDYKQTVSEFELEILQKHKELTEARSELLLLRNERRYLDTSIDSDETDQEVFLGGKPAGEKKPGGSGEKRRENSASDSSKSRKDCEGEPSGTRYYGNQRYRMVLANLIWEGFKKIKDDK